MASDERSTRWTRRSFLERLGLAGGSAAVITAMRSWDLMAQTVGSRPQLSGRGTGKRAIVLGAGLSGLAAAYELGKLGYDYQVLEARDRVGGVSWTVRRGDNHAEMGPNAERQACGFDEGLYFNAGPWRIPHFHTAVLDYCKELDVPLEIFINEAEASYLYYDGEDAGPLANTRVRLREVRADLLGYTAELLAKAVRQDDLDLPLTAEDRDRLMSFLVTEGYLDRTDLAYKGSAARGPGDPYGFGALLQSPFGGQVRSVTGGTGQAPMFQPIGGMDQLPRAFQRALGDRIHLNTAVQSVRQAPDEVVVTYTDTKTGRGAQATADFVVACVPLTVLSALDVDLSPEMAEAVKATGYSASAKIGMQMRRRFWEEDDRIFGGHLYSNLPLGQFSYPSNDYFSAKGILLGFYGNGRQGGLVDQPLTGRLEHVLTHASKVHPQMRQEYENGYCVFWEKIEYSRGAYAGGGGGGAARREQLGKLDGRVAIGCAAASTDPAWQQGAIEAGWHAVERVHERAMRG